MLLLLPSKKEPRGLNRDGSEKRVDRCTLIPWQRGKSIAWDVTVPDTLAPSHLPKTSAVSGAAAEDASLRKIAKYTGVRQSLDFVAIAIETLGPINADGVSFLTELGRAADSHFGRSARNQLPPAKDFDHFATIQFYCLPWQLKGGVGNHRLSVGLGSSVG